MINPKIKKILLLIATVMLALSGLLGMVNPSANAKAQPTHDNYLKNVKKKGTLVMGTAPDYPPYEFIGKNNGSSQVYGADILLGQKIAHDMGVKLKVKSMSFDSLMVALRTGKIDMIIAGLNKTPQRAKSVDFTNSYYTSGTDLVINKKDKNKIKSYHDLSGQSVGGQVGSVQYDLAKSQIKNVNLKGMESVDDLVLALKTGKVSAVPMDASVAKAYVEHNSGIMQIPAGFSASSGASSDNNAAFSKGAKSLVASANKTIQQVQAKHEYTDQFVPQAIKHMTNNKNQSVANSMWSYKDYFLKGTEYTIMISLISVCFGIVLGIIFALMRLSHNWLLHAIAVVYIEFIRGTPLMVQIMFVYFGLGAVVNVPALTSGIVAISINSGAYVAEIIRSGITSINVGQSEASLSLGLSQSQTMRYIVLPQAIKNIWPALGNEFISLIKNSSLASIIGVGELMYQMRAVQADTYQGIAPIAVIMIIYFIITFAISRTMKFYEGKMNHGTNN
ncbi:ABC transporter permease [Philodulcilactobacillus myokoensis]|uniref:ABC transporter permease n=1 Tax=Philodulcilactobacillus myokoensis TaxID=2929573 RepID=A0A9W6B323_9LACO|nr:ABC transporter substrate-binding protein/permease [Philodulcilactobacillus myokoensis]GLB47553.1 ABC transporter permease [Philodulcilactobacillus myokoensis]